MDSYFLNIFGNILAPIISGLFLFIFFLYFRFIENSQTTAVRYFRIFLITFSVFLLSRPVQILIGPHPVPLVINDIRIVLYDALTVPMVIIADFNRDFKTEKKNARIIIAIGALMGILYTVFNHLTTIGSKIIFTIGETNVYDNHTPSLTPPYFGREVTIAISVAIGLMLLIDSIRKLVRGVSQKLKSGERNRKILVYNIGKLIFAVFYIVGLVTKQWWIYYICSIPSVCFLGMGVLIEIRENKLRIDKVSSYIREDLIHNISLNQENHENFLEMAELLKIPRGINTFMILKISKDDRNKIENTDELAESLHGTLEGDKHIILRIGTGIIGICLEEKREGCKSRITETAETIREKLEKILKLTVNIGIGRTYDSLEELKNSYHEAMHAADYASAIEGGQVVHIEDIQNESTQNEYPVKEKDGFLSAVKLGDGENAEKYIKAFIRKLAIFEENSHSLLKIRVYELIGSIVDAAIAGGGDVEKLFSLSRKLYEDAEILRTLPQLETWLIKRCDEIVGIVKSNRVSKTNSFVNRAKKFIEENYNRQISVRDVAHNVCISESYLKSVFRKSCGYTYSEYLTKIRIDKARELLNTTEKTVTEIAFDVGYQTPNAFSAIFKKTTNLTPTQYKKR